MFAQGDRRRAGVQDGGGGEVRGEHVWVDIDHVHFDVDREHVWVDLHHVYLDVDDVDVDQVYLEIDGYDD